MLKSELLESENGARSKGRQKKGWRSIGCLWSADPCGGVRYDVYGCEWIFLQGMKMRLEKK